MVAAASLGAGKVIALPDHQWLNFNSYGGDADMAAFYNNSIAWLAGTTSKTSIKLVTLNSAYTTWLTGQGYTNVVTATTSNLATELSDADVFAAAWLGSNPSQATIDTTVDFANDGGGVLMCDYGVGYQWWWGKATPDIPGNIILRRAGISFIQRYPHGGGSQTITRGVGQMDAEKVISVIQNPGGYTTEEKDQAIEAFDRMTGSFPANDSLQARLDDIFWSSIGSINPTPATPVSDSLEKVLLSREAGILQSLPPSEVTAHRTAEDVYGVIPPGSPRVSQVVNIDTSVPRWHSTGLYAAPGEIVTITVPASVTAAGYTVRLGGHVDNISSRSSWDRVPYGISRSYALDSTSVQAASAFGGAIYIDTNTTTNVTPSFDVTISNAMEAPYFVLGTTTDADWNNGVRDLPAPFAELVCENLIISLPSSMIRNIDNMEAIMTYWNAVVEWQDYIGAMDDIRDDQMAERFNVDVQISAGLLHAGYPIQGPTWASGGLVNYQQLTTSGDWGYFHELGHEMQRRPDKLWGGWDNPYTFPGDVEVTVNIFANAALEQLVPNTGTAGWGYSAHPDLVFQRALTSVSAGGTFDSKDPYPFYFQLADGFDWETYRAVFQTYHDDVANDPGALPTNAAEEKDQWLVRWSQTAGVSMKKFMVDEWGLTVSQSALDQIAALPDWLPPLGGLNSASTPEGAALVLDLAGNALSYDGVATVSNVTQPANGVMVDNGDGTWTYTPNAGFAGSDTLDYDVTSSTGHAFTTTLEITVDQGVWYEQWNGIAGTAISDLTADPDFPNSPDVSSVLSGADIGSGIADNYGARIYTWLVAPSTGDYTFWIASDDNGELHLSSDAAEANKQLIASVPGWSGYQQWNKYTEQQSATVSLVAGERYYLEALVKEGGGGDHLAIAWSGPGFNQTVLEGSATSLSSNLTPVASNAAGSVPEDAAIGTSVATVTASDPDANDTLSFAITAGNDGSAFAINSATGEVTVAGALDFETQANYNLTVTVSDDGVPVLSATAAVAISITDVLETTDSDSDGFSDALEIALGSDPGNPASTPPLAYSGLHSYWPANESSGTDVADLSLNGFHATVSGANFGVGRTGNALSFDGVDDEMTAGNQAALLGTGDFSLSLWVRPAVGFNSTGTLIQQREPGGSGYLGEYMLTVNGDGTVGFFIYNNGYQVNLTTTASIADNTWHHIVARRSGSNVEVLIDGQVAASGSGPVQELLSLEVAVGFDARDNNKYFAGEIDEVAVFGRSLSNADVAVLGGAPVVSPGNFQVAEDVVVGTSVGTVSASDPNGDGLAYAITAGNTGGAFTIDGSGNITTAAVLDYETTVSYALSVLVTDTVGFSAATSVNITVIDVVEVTPPLVSTGAASSITQNGADVGFSLTDDGGEASTITLYYGESNEGAVAGAWDNSVGLGAQTAGAGSSSLSGLTDGTNYYFTFRATNSAGEDWGSVGSFTTEADTSPKLVRTIVNSVANGAWTSVDLGQNYNSAVIIATPIYPNSSVPPVVTRIRNVAGSGFEVKIDRTDGSTATTSVDVSIVAVEEGVYTQAADGVTMEAVKYNSTITGSKNAWSAEARSYQNSYTSPVVVGQVMSANDANWSTFWCMGSSRTSPPNASNLNVGKHVAEDPNKTRANETVGYIVIESGNGSVNGVAYTAGVGSDIVRGTGNTSSGYSYSLSGLSAASAAAVSIAAMDGGDGGWAVLYGATPMTASQLTLAVDEDQLSGNERNHTTEQLGYLVFE